MLGKFWQRNISDLLSPIKMGRPRKTCGRSVRRRTLGAAKESLKTRHDKNTRSKSLAQANKHASDDDGNWSSQCESDSCDSEDDISGLVYERVEAGTDNILDSSAAENVSSNRLDTLNLNVASAFDAVSSFGTQVQGSNGSQTGVTPTDSATLAYDISTAEKVTSSQYNLLNANIADAFDGIPSSGTQVQVSNVSQASIASATLSQSQSQQTANAATNKNKPKQTYFEYGQFRLSQLKKQENAHMVMKSKEASHPTATKNDIDKMLPIKDLRSYSYPLQTAMVESGYWDHLKRQIASCLSASDDYSERKDVLPQTVAQALSTATRRKLLFTISALGSFMAELEKIHKSGKSPSLKRVAKAVCRYRDDISWKTLLKRYREFINDYGTLEGVRNKCRSPYSLIEDESAREIMRHFMDRACRAKPPATAADFRAFILSMFLCSISIRTSQVWLYILGYRYRRVDAKELYNDGHNREDVKKALAEYTTTMKLLARKQRSYYGLNMDEIVEPAIDLQTEKRVFFNFHDEVSTHSKDSVSRSYRRHGSTGKMQSKSRGEQGHASTWVSEEGTTLCIVLISISQHFILSMFRY